MKKYENLFILRPELGEEKVQENITIVEELIKKHSGTVTNTENRGKKRLSYRIQKIRNGIYISMDFEIDPKKIKEIERGLKLKEEVVKYIITLAQERDESSTTKILEEGAVVSKEKVTEDAAH